MAVSMLQNQPVQIWYAPCTIPWPEDMAVIFALFTWFNATIGDLV